MRWVACELHAHTLHSDGRFTVETLAREARELGLEAVALMDHNTNSGVREIPEAERKTGVTIVAGMELTTFYGHMLALGTESYVEWRSLTRAGILSAVDAIHALGACAGVAHPFHPGNPFCTGCHWDFEGLEWSRMEYLEIWSEADPWTRPKNRLSLALWNGLLDSGCRITGVSARDFHAPDRSLLPAVTYLGAAGLSGGERPLTADVTEAIRAGRAFVTLGPMLVIEVRAAGAERVHGPGELIPRSVSGPTLDVRVAWDSNAREPLWAPHASALTVRLFGNLGELASGAADCRQGSLDFSLPRGGCKWLRAELHGRLRGDEGMIAFTNPVYLEPPLLVV